MACLWGPGRFSFPQGFFHITPWVSCGESPYSSLFFVYFGILASLYSQSVIGQSLNSHGLLGRGYGFEARLMIWTRQPAGLGAVATEYKDKRLWEKWRLGFGSRVRTVSDLVSVFSPHFLKSWTLYFLEGHILAVNRKVGLFLGQSTQEVTGVLK